MHTNDSTPVRYPIATMATYGPDDTRATKLVASVFRRARQKSPGPTRTWFSEAGDVRNDPLIALEVADWLRRQRVTETLQHDRIIGCPHEEGIDYPLGRTCPQCPFWATVDRYTHEPIRAPRATMPAEQVIVELGRMRSTQPVEALTSADAHRDVLVTPLLQVLERCVADPEAASDDDARRFSYALYLMARWRETSAYPLVTRWVALPDADVSRLTGDIHTQDGPRILAAVCDGNLEPIKQIVLDREANEFSRSVALEALALLAVWGEVPRGDIVAYFDWLSREGLERKPSYIWDSLASESADIEALEVFPALRRAFDEELIDPFSIGREDLRRAERAPRGSLIERKQDTRGPIDDIVSATSWWGCFNDDRDDELPSGFALDDTLPPAPYHAPVKVGRNEPCPCGSGKKYKRCCGQ